MVAQLNTSLLIVSVISLTVPAAFVSNSLQPTRSLFMKSIASIPRISPCSRHGSVDSLGAQSRKRYHSHIDVIISQLYSHSYSTHSFIFFPYLVTLLMYVLLRTLFLVPVAHDVVVLAVLSILLASLSLSRYFAGVYYIVEPPTKDWDEWPLN